MLLCWRRFKFVSVSVSLFVLFAIVNTLLRNTHSVWPLKCLLH